MNMAYVGGKAKEISVEKESLQESMDVTFLCQKELDKEVWELTNEGLYTSGVYFEISKEEFLFLYLDLDLSFMEFLKVVHGGNLVDEEAVAPQKIGNPSPSRNLVDEESKAR